MRYRKRFDVEGGFAIAMLAFWVFTVIAWIINFVKLVFDIVGINSVDFAQNNWGVIIAHILGVVTGIGSVVTVWF